MLSFLFQDGAGEGRAYISCESTKMETSCWTIIDRRALQPTKNRYPLCKDKEEAAVRWEEGHNQDKIKPHTHRWVTHQLENNNTKEIRPLL